MGRHPVDDHADAGLVQPVDEVTEPVGVAEPRGGGEVRRDLVAPGTAVRMLHDREELDVGEAQVAEVRHQLVGDLAVGEVSLPRSEVHLVDRHRLANRLSSGALGHPVAVSPGVRRLVDHRGRRRRDLGVERHRVGLLAPLAVGAEDRELVARAGPDPGQEQLPHAGLAQLAHRVLATVPVVEGTLEAHPAGGGRPHGERGAGDGVAQRRLVPVHPGAEHLPELLVPALVDEVQVDLTERWQVAEGVIKDQRVGVVGDLEAVVGDLRLAGRRRPGRTPTQTPPCSWASGTSVSP